MPTYDYQCEKCEIVEEVIHSIKDNPVQRCPKCKKQMERLIGSGSCVIVGGLNGSIQDRKDKDRQKKVKDLDRAVKKRKKLFGTDAVGTPVDRPDPRHVVRRGKTVGGQQIEVDKQEFIKAAAKDKVMVEKAKAVLKNTNTKNA